MASSSSKPPIKTYYTTLYVIEIKSRTLAEIQDGQDRHLE